MSSNIRVTRICEYCKQSFEARKTTSRLCSDLCSKRAYKARQRDEKIKTSNEQTRKIIDKPLLDLKAEEFLTIDEASRLVRISRRTLYRLNERGELPFVKLIRRTIIRRADIDKLVERPTQLMEASRPDPVALENCYTLKEILEKYPISNKALYDLIRRHNIPKQHKGKFVYIPKMPIDQLLTLISG
ncbi:helix-turn-helix domain-containing protein [Spirosoma harenae]